MSANLIKLIAAVCMLGDHVAWEFFPTNSSIGFVLHFLGRITAPVMAFFIAEGYFHTHDIKRYIARLAAFAAISYFPFCFFEHTYTRLNVIFGLLIGLLMLWAWSSSINDFLRFLIVVSGCMFCFLFVDWAFFVPAWVLFFGIFHDRVKWQITWYLFIAVFAVSFYAAYHVFGLLLAVPLILVYNGKRGRGGKIGKWGFYVFYPAHLLLISILA